MTLKPSPNATFSPVSGAGAMPSVWPDGLTIDLYGPAVARASHSPLPENKEDSRMNATYGPISRPSSRSDALQSSLESRLRQRLNGSDLCEVTWKPWATPWGQCLSRPRARGRTTSGTDTGLWPTATQRDHKDGPYCPNVPVNGLLGRTVWATPVARPAGGTPEQFLQRKRKAVANGAKLGVALTALSLQVMNGSSEPTEKPGALNPEFVCWLMGYPIEWVNCADLGTPSTRGPRRGS